MKNRIDQILFTLGINWSSKSEQVIDEHIAWRMRVCEINDAWDIIVERRAPSMFSDKDIDGLIFLKKCGIPFVQRGSGRTLLHYICANGDMSKCRKLFDYLVAEYSVNVRDYTGATPLHDACMTENMAAIELLLDRSASPTVRDVAGNTPGDWLSPGMKYEYMVALAILGVPRQEQMEID